LPQQPVRKAPYFRVEPGHPYYIQAPDYRDTSSGIAVLHKLCHVLNLIGEDAYLVGCTQRSPLLKTPILTPEIAAGHENSNRQPIVIYPEVVQGNPLGAPVVARYFLNKEAFLSGKKTNFIDTDLLFHFSPFCKQGHDRSDGLLRFPIVDLTLFSPPEKPVPREGSFIYQNRWPIEKIDFSRLPTSVEL